MSDRQQVILTAAVDVVAGQGLRGLTHRAVDQRAGVPLGSTSNAFRTRDALLAATIGHAGSRWQDELAACVAPAASDPAAAVAALLRRLTGPARTITLARYVLQLEAGCHPDLASGLAALVQPLQVWAGDLGSDGLLTGDALAALVDGLLLRQLTRPDPAFDADATARAALQTIR